MPAPFLLDAADAAAIAEAATSREPNDYGRYYEEYDDDEEVRQPLLCLLPLGIGHCVVKREVVLGQAFQRLVESDGFFRRGSCSALCSVKMLLMCLV